MNLTGQTVQVPATLSAIDGTARFQVVDTNWKPIQHPIPNAATPKSIPLQPGARVTLRVVLNVAGGYQLSQPGTYHIVLLGRAIGLPHSNTLTVRLVP